MSPDQLIRVIGRKGDDQFKNPLPEKDEPDHHVPLDDKIPPIWSLLYRGATYVEDKETYLGGILFVFLVPILFVVDLVHLAVRLILWPPVRLFWDLERRWARWRGVRVFCAACYHSMEEPWVCCPHRRCPRRIQGRLRPTLNALFQRPCTGCGRSRWRVVGHRLAGNSWPLVCRHTDRMSGCFLTLRNDALGRDRRLRRVVAVGVVSATKLLVMAQLLLGLRGVGLRGRRYQPATELSALECLLFEQVLASRWPRDRPPEQLGRVYQLARTFVLDAGPGQPLFLLHNVPQTWLTPTVNLAREGLTWSSVDGLLLVLDRSRMGGGVGGELPQAEMFARVVRVTEEFCAIPPGTALPYRVLVVLPLKPTDPALRHLPIDKSGGTSGALAEELVSHEDPALYGLLRRLVPGKALRFATGLLPDGLALEQTAWLRAGVAWLARLGR